jgi:transposase
MTGVRGRERKQRELFSMLSPEKRVPADHPLRPVKRMVEAALKGMAREMEEMYSPMGRASIPPERLLKAMLLIALYSIRSERLLCEELNYNLLYRWFLNMGLDEPSSGGCDAPLQPDSSPARVRHSSDRVIW